ncbi:hypothetical protein J4217_00170 [Candidatus Pacearchaeota archaeon]|nr:hypothetical protein [Candidatus Pacearchaeota archaeon]
MKNSRKIAIVLSIILVAISLLLVVGAVSSGFIDITVGNEGFHDYSCNNPISGVQFHDKGGSGDNYVSGLYCSNSNLDISSSNRVDLDPSRSSSGFYNYSCQDSTVIGVNYHDKGGSGDNYVNQLICGRGKFSYNNVEGIDLTLNGGGFYDFYCAGDKVLVGVQFHDKGGSGDNYVNKIYCASLNVSAPEDNGNGTGENNETNQTQQLNITVNYPLNGMVIDSNVSSLFLNYTVQGIPNSCWYDLDSTLNNLPGCVGMSISMTNGTHELRVYANNSQGQVFNSSLINFVFNLFASDNEGNGTDGGNNQTNQTGNPYIKIIYPLNNSVLNVSNINLKFIAANVSSCWFNLNYGNNASIVQCQNTSFSAGNGSYILHLYANNSIGQISSDSIYFTVSLPGNSGNGGGNGGDGGGRTRNGARVINVSDLDDSDKVTYSVDDYLPEEKPAVTNESELNVPLLLSLILLILLIIIAIILIYILRA